MFEFLKSRRRRIEAEVLAVTRVSPHAQRITVGGAEVADFVQIDEANAPAAWVKVSLPGGASRAYTIRCTDRQAGTLDLEFVLHGGHGHGGPLSGWAEGARVGDRLGLSGPRDGGFHPPTDARWMLLAGDATALPAMQAIAAGLPAGLDVEVCVEVASPDDRQTFHSPAMPHVRWLEASSVPGAALSWALMNQRPSSAPGYVWMAGESGAMRALRGYYLQSLGLASDRVSAKGYWKVGEAAHRGA